MIAGKSIGCYATAQVRCESVFAVQCALLFPLVPPPSLLGRRSMKLKGERP